MCVARSPVKWFAVYIGRYTNFLSFLLVDVLFRFSLVVIVVALVFYRLLIVGFSSSWLGGSAGSVVEFY